MTEHVARLCENLSRDPGLRAALAAHGADWEALATAIRRGEDADRALQAIESAAEAAGIDGLTSSSRRFEHLPSTGEAPRSIEGWSRCPHPRPCGRAHHTEGGTAAVCSLTGEPLTPVTVISG